MIHRFKEFLIDNGIYDAYIDNACDVSMYDPQFYIFYAFSWSETPEGYKFWQNINRKWREIVLSEELKYNESEQ